MIVFQPWVESTNPCLIRASTSLKSRSRLTAYLVRCKTYWDGRLGVMRVDPDFCRFESAHTCSHCNRPCYSGSGFANDAAARFGFLAAAVAR